jgi:hypothetical protein
MSDILILTRLDGSKVHVLKSSIEEWYEDEDNKGCTKIVEVDGKSRTIKETPGQFENIYNATS